MAIAEFRFPSQVLQTPVAFNAILPDSGDGPFAVLYLLHGMYDDYTGWMRRSRIEVYVEGLPLVVIMPNGQNSFYANVHDGPQFHHHIVSEVIANVERLLPVKRTRAGRAIGGLSMGGYGAMRLALTHPDEFVSVHSHSGALMRGSVRCSAKDEPHIHSIFGSDPTGTPHDLIALARYARRSGKMPRILFDCGTEDFTLEANRAFHAALTTMHIPHEYREFPGGHTWDYWDEHIRQAIDFHAAALRIRRNK